MIAWCIMSNHMHLIFRSIKVVKPELLLGDFKRFTSKTIVKAIQENYKESRKEFLLEKFKMYQTNHQTSRIICSGDIIITPYSKKLRSNKVIKEKIDYIHNNPVKAGLVYKAEDYVYSSTTDYAGEEGLIKNILIFEYYG
ncbi:transposase [Aestuariibaculum marinum]|uniref:transposase n=1 Tax=Aestuariibaculum marinum TaxID=2683592 RepID=UPI00293BFAE3|nr:transposase [Aestuariibaculum marinum]